MHGDQCCFEGCLFFHYPTGKQAEQCYFDGPASPDDATGVDERALSDDATGFGGTALSEDATGSACNIALSLGYCAPLRGQCCHM